ncbi:MAG TPA: hypothetical protein VH988_26195 [Thermoanaerobaculia bacterium]|nr:hypothetical protein [Thermoanaerobaculia bacterium]
MKTASFTVRASTDQALRWNRAAEAEGHRSAGTWLACAADAYLKVRAKAGMPLPLAWRHGRLFVRLEDGTEPELRGWVSLPFGIFHGSPEGPIPQGSTHLYSLVYLPARRIVATFRTAGHCRALAAELAGVWARSGGEETDTRAGPIVDRHVREAK